MKIHAESRSLWLRSCLLLLDPDRNTNPEKSSPSQRKHRPQLGWKVSHTTKESSVWKAHLCSSQISPSLKLISLNIDRSLFKDTQLGPGPGPVESGLSCLTLTETQTLMKKQEHWKSSRFECCCYRLLLLTIRLMSIFEINQSTNRPVTL